MNFIRVITVQMNNLIVKNEPILALLQDNLLAAEPWMSERFLKIIRHYYHSPFFKNFLDLIMTSAFRGRLKFKLHDAKFFDLDEGNCLTMVEQNNFHYLITIKQLAGEVVIHEMGHLLEKELQFLISLSEFASMVHADLGQLPPLYRFLEPRLNELFVKALEGYKPVHHLSEIFARFFEFFAAAKDVAFDRPRNYLFKDAVAVFSRSLNWFESKISDSKLLPLIDSAISQNSQKYLNQNYSFKSFSNKITNKSGPGNSIETKWGVKSNKSNPFN